MRKLFFFLNLFLITATGFGQHSNKTIVLVPGIYSTAAVWDLVVPELKKQGFDVIAVTLPGHGNAPGDVSQLTMITYAQAVEKMIGHRKNIILVGHSMGGVVISQVGEDIPGQIKRLVYIAALIPKNGESFFDKTGQDANKDPQAYFTVDNVKGTLNMDTSKVYSLFADDLPRTLVSDIVKGQKYEEPINPLLSKVVLSDPRFGKVNKSFIYTKNDKGVLYSQQQSMAKDAHITRTYIINSSHLPMLSRPKQLAKLIIDAGK